MAQAHSMDARPPASTIPTKVSSIRLVLTPGEHQADGRGPGQGLVDGRKNEEDAGSHGQERVQHSLVSSW